MIVTLILLACGAAPAQPQDIDIQMRLTKTSILLGEPVWVDVIVTNRTTQPLRISMGSACFGNRPLSVEIPEAESGSGELKRCGGLNGGSCLSAAPSLLDSRNSFTQRYVLAGDFRITHPGAYHALLEKKVSYAVAVPGDSFQFMGNAPEQTAKETVVLEVRPADPAKLLAIEQALVTEATAPYAEPPLPAAALQAPSDSEARRKALDARQYETMAKQTAIAEGLANFPVAGMEPVFDDWLVSGKNFGLLGLRTLNTPESRHLVAQAADASEGLYRLWRQHVYFADAQLAAAPRLFGIWRSGAVSALVDMGDASHLPLLEKLSGDDSAEVRQQAILGLGLLGGESELPKLVALVENATNPHDRSDAIQAMGDTASLKAVPGLISFFTLPDADEPSRSTLALTTITHHSLPPADTRTNKETQALWRDWWEQNKDTARAYGPFECSDR
jgi:HEAT repeat protein